MAHRMQHTTKKQLSEFNLEEARGWVIDYFLKLEALINDIITDYYEPKDKDKFKKILLHSSILDFGSKCKILGNIEHVKNKTIDNIRQLASIRNSFAHANVIEQLHLANRADLKYNRPILSISSRISVMNSSGKIKTEDAYEYLCTFLNLYKAAKIDLVEIRDRYQ